MRRRLELLLDLTSRCNLRCVMCHFSNTDRVRFRPFDVGDDPRGNMEGATLEHIARELFPVSTTVGVGCAAEPLLHPEFAHVLDLLRTHRVPDTWVQTNLQVLDESAAAALVRNSIRTVAVSIDGTDRESYETIRRGASWRRLQRALALLGAARTRAASKLPRLRITFTWMRSNREHLARLPAFAAQLGAAELDVRFVAPTVGVDTSGELLTSEDPATLTKELWTVAREAIRRGLRLHAFPALGKEAGADDTMTGRVSRRLWLLRSGLDRPSRWRRSLLPRLEACPFPGRLLLIRPNGAVLPCPFWEQEPVAMVPRDNRAEILEGCRIAALLDGGRDARPALACPTCTQKNDALFRPHQQLADRTA